ncbi:methyltransferase domain-containing protein [Niabella terrae]
MIKAQDFAKAQGHWILASMGKKVLRPGGRALTRKLISGLAISPADRIVELAPGLGYTATLALKDHPESYIGIDADRDAVAFLTSRLRGPHIRFRQGSAADTGLASQSKDKVYGEAMLTMQADHRKSEIIREAHRILIHKGLYAIHELGLKDVDADLKVRIQRDLAEAIKVNARPLTAAEWQSLLEKEGFKVKAIHTHPMALLEPGRILQDEGFWRTLKIGWNILSHPAARKRILKMRQVFQRHRTHLNAIVIIAEKL